MVRVCNDMSGVVCVVRGSERGSHAADRPPREGPAQEGGRTQQSCFSSPNTASLSVPCAGSPSEDSTSGEQRAVVGVRCSVIAYWPGCRSKLLTDQPNGDKLPESVYIMPGKSQVRGMHTVIR